MKFLIFTIIILSTNFSVAKEGTVGNGGSSTQLIQTKEFLDVGRAINRDFELWASVRYSIDGKQLAKTIQNTTFNLTSKQLFLDGKEVSAINNPNTMTITFNAKEWGKLKASGCCAVRSLLLHELLGLMKIDDENYSISGDYLLALEYLSNITHQKEYVLHVSQTDENDMDGFPARRENNAREIAINNVLKQVISQIDGLSFIGFSGLVGYAMVTRSEPGDSNTTSLKLVEKSTTVAIDSCNNKLQNLGEILRIFMSSLISKKLITSAKVEQVVAGRCNNFKINIVYSKWY